MSILETTLLNECLRGNVTCDASKECVDYVGGYSCECPAGKTGTDCDQGEFYSLDKKDNRKVNLILSLPSSEIDHL